jgi:hypothetical protein
MGADYWYAVRQSQAQIISVVSRKLRIAISMNRSESHQRLGLRRQSAASTALSSA